MALLVFFSQVPVLFNGCRSGEIFSMDLRQRGRRDQSWKASRFHQESAITSVRVLQDENYLLAADMLGQVRKISLSLTHLFTSLLTVFLSGDEASQVEAATESLSLSDGRQVDLLIITFY